MGTSYFPKQRAIFFMIALLVSMACEKFSSVAPTSLESLPKEGTMAVDDMVGGSAREAVYITHLEGISIFDVLSMTKTGEIQGMEGVVSRFVIDSKGTFGYACAKPPERLYKINLSSNCIVDQLDLPLYSRVWDLVLTPDDATIFATLYGDHSIAVVDAGTMSLTSCIPMPGTKRPNSIAIDRWGRNVYVSCYSHACWYRIDPVTCQFTGACVIWAPVFVLSHNCRYGYGGLNDDLPVVDLDTFSVIDNIPLPGMAGAGIQVTKNPTKVYVMCVFEDESCVLCVVNTKKRIVTDMIDLPLRLLRLGINSNGKIAVGTSYDGYLVFIDLNNGEAMTVIALEGAMSMTFHKTL